MKSFRDFGRDLWDWYSGSNFYWGKKVVFLYARNYDHRQKDRTLIPILRPLNRPSRAGVYDPTTETWVDVVNDVAKERELTLHVKMFGSKVPPEKDRDHNDLKQELIGYYRRYLPRRDFLQKKYDIDWNYVGFQIKDQLWAIKQASERLAIVKSAPEWAKEVGIVIDSYGPGSCQSDNIGVYCHDRELIGPKHQITWDESHKVAYYGGVSPYQTQLNSTSEEPEPC